MKRIRSRKAASPPLRRQARRCAPARRAVASLELILVAFPLLLMFIALLWMGAVGIQSGEVAIEARHAAWLTRSAIAASPFSFTDYDQGRVQKQQDAPVDVSPLVNQLVVPTSEHVVFAGAWQNPHVDLNRSPNWQLATKLMEKAGQQKTQELRRVQQGLGELPQLVQGRLRARVDEVSQQLSGKHGSLDELRRTLKGEFGKWNRENETKQNKAKQESHNETLKKKMEISAKSEAATLEVAKTTEKIEAKQMQLDTKRQELKEANDDPDAKKEDIDRLKEDVGKLEEEVDQLKKRRIRLVKGIELLVEAQKQLQIADERIEDD